MPYMQLVEFDTQRGTQEVKGALDTWLNETKGQRALQMAVVASDHDRPNHYWELLEFPSRQEAEMASGMPETKAAYNRWSGLLDGEPTFHNLDIIEQVGGVQESTPAALGPWRTPGGG